MSLEIDILATNAFGQPVNGDARRRLRALLTNPTVETWDGAYGILIAPNMTVWQAVCKVASGYQNIGRRTDQHGRMVEDRKRVPDRRTLERALFYATH